MYFRHSLIKFPVYLRDQVSIQLIIILGCNIQFSLYHKVIQNGAMLLKMDIILMQNLMRVQMVEDILVPVEFFVGQMDINSIYFRAEYLLCPEIYDSNK